MREKSLSEESWAGRVAAAGERKIRDIVHKETWFLCDIYRTVNNDE